MTILSDPSGQGEFLGSEPTQRLEAWLASAMKRKPSQEAKLAGVVRALCPFSRRLGGRVAELAGTLVRRASFERPLYPAIIRAFAELGGASAAGDLERALGTEEAGGLSTLSAACSVKSPRISQALASVARSRHPHLAFAAEVARLSRAESDGEHVAVLAPKIKESHRIALCVEIFVPLLRQGALPLSVAPALGVLRDAERHLGRWLVFAEIAARAGDDGPLLEASQRADSGPVSARSAWALVAWALRKNGATPEVRPTVELVARLSDRPSADRDPTFLYRLAEAGCHTARPMLESLARPPLRTETAVRSALYLARDHGRDDLRAQLQGLAENPQHEGLGGLAAAALYDLGEKETALGLSQRLVQSRRLEAFAWGALLHATQSDRAARVVSETNYRRVQHGWVE